MLDRIPSTVTEIVCHNPHETCGGNTNYHCRYYHQQSELCLKKKYTSLAECLRQIRARMAVAYQEINAYGVVELQKQVGAQSSSSRVP